MQERTGINWMRLRAIIENVPSDLDRTKKKEPIKETTREKIYKRDKGVCFICGSIGEYGCKNPYNDSTGRHNIHHIIPNGKSADYNLVTLCEHCHRVVHEILYIEGRWRYTRI